MASGDAAIVESLGLFPEEHVPVSDRQAIVLLREHDPEMIRFWNGDEDRR